MTYGPEYRPALPTEIFIGGDYGQEVFDMLRGEEGMDEIEPDEFKFLAHLVEKIAIGAIVNCLAKYNPDRLHVLQWLPTADGKNAGLMLDSYAIEKLEDKE